MGITRTNNRGFRNQSLAPRTGGGRDKYYESLAAGQDILNKRASGAPAIIGGQYVQPEDFAGRNAALGMRRDALKDSNAQQLMRQQMGSPQASLPQHPATAGGTTPALPGGDPANAGPPGGAPFDPGLPGQPGMNNDPMYPGGPAFAAASPSAPAPMMRNPAPTIDADVGNRSSSLRSSPKMSPPSTTLGLEPEFAQGGQVPMQDPYADPRTPEEIMAQEVAQQALASQERGGTMHRPPQQMLQRQQPTEQWIRGESQGGSTMNRMAPAGPRVIDNNQQQGLRGMRRGGCVAPTKKLKQPGYARGAQVKMPEEPGPIGDPAMDTGEDTVEAIVRPGEVLLNPPTVAHMGGGDYDEGLRMLNEQTLAATGEPMGAEYKDGQLNAAKSAVVPEYLTGATRTGPGQPRTYAQTGRGVTTPEPQNYVERDAGVRRAPPKTSTAGDAYVKQQATEAGERVRQQQNTRARGEATKINERLNEHQNTRARAEATKMNSDVDEGRAAENEKARKQADKANKKFDKKNPKVPKARSFGQKWLGTADNFKASGQTLANDLKYLSPGWKDSLSLRDPAKYSKVTRGAGRLLGTVAAPLAVATGAHDFAQGMEEGDYGKAAWGAGDTAAGVGLLGGGALAPAYLAGRGGWEAGKAYYNEGDNAQELLDAGEQDIAVPEWVGDALESRGHGRGLGSLQDVAGYASSVANNINPEWGMSELDQANLRDQRTAWDMQEDVAGTPANAVAQTPEAQAQAQAQVQAQAQAAAEQAAAPYGRAFGAGNVELPTNGLRSAAEAVGPGGMNIVQNTGGPNDERIIREDIDGVPTFTNVRRGGFDGSAANLQREADARVQQDQQIGLRNGQVVQQLRDNAPTYDQAGVDQRRQENLAMQQTAMEASGRAGSRTKPTVFRKSLEDRYQVLGEDGTPKGADIVKVDIVERVISQLNPGIIKEWGMPFQELPEAIQQEVFTQDIDPILNDTAIARQSQKNQDFPTSSLPRTGDNGLRVRPGSDMSFWGDAVFGNATLGEYWNGAFDDSPINDRMVRDPLGDQNAANNRIPLQRLLRGTPDEQEALRRYGYDG